MQKSLLKRAPQLLLAAFLCSSAHAAEKNFELDIAQGVVPAPQRTLKVEKGDAVNLTVRSDTAGELHLHGYNLSLKLVPGQSARLSFTAFATGRYPFEWHGADTRATGSSHHRGPPLAAIEVRPK